MLIHDAIPFVVRLSSSRMGESLYLQRMVLVVSVSGLDATVLMDVSCGTDFPFYCIALESPGKLEREEEHT